MADKVFEYNGNHITFQLGNGDTMVNATEMAKPFGKTPKDFFRTEAIKEFCIMLCECKSLKMTKWAKTPIRNTTEFINSLSVVRGIPLTELVIVNQGGINQGTWMHKDVAIEFARWLSPDFAIWCNDRIFELMKYGFTATDQTLDRLIAQPELGVELFTALKEERERHAEELEREQSISNNLFDLSLFQTKYIADLEQESLLNKLAARRYLNIANEQQSILKQMGIKIPTNLKISRRVYAANILRLRS